MDRAAYANKKALALLLKRASPTSPVYWHFSVRKFTYLKYSLMLFFAVAIVQPLRRIGDGTIIPL